MTTSGFVLDAGAFIALERRDGTMVHLVRLFAQRGTPLVTSAGVVAQVWRGTPRQAPIAYLLEKTVVAELTNAVARTVGRILGLTRTRDPIDGHVVLLARERSWPILTSDPEDLRAIDPRVVVETI